MVPDFDPINGNADAKLLFLLEKPGPMTDPDNPRKQGSGFVSCDNDDATAAAVFGFFLDARIDRSRIAIWNTIPHWDGSITYNAYQRRAGVSSLYELFKLLPKLSGVVLVGGAAAKAESVVRNAGYRVFTSAHPSPKVRATNRALWVSIPARWAEAGATCLAHR